MSYIIKTNNQEVVIEGGLAVFMPFDFDRYGSYGIHPHRATVCFHLIHKAGKEINYPTLSERLINQTSFEFKDTNGDTLFKLDDYKANLYLPNQAVGNGEAILVLRGLDTITSQINDIKLPKQKFPEWGHESSDSVTWKGALKRKENNHTLLKTNFVRCSINIQQGWLRNLTAIGPVTDNEEIFEWLVVERGNWMEKVGNKVYVDYSKGALPTICFEDMRRDKQLTLFGGDVFGVAQVTGGETQGAAFLCYGSFAREGAIKRLDKISRVVHHDGEEFAIQLERWAATVLVDHSLINAKKEGNPLLEVEETLFQGLSVWNLKLRRNEDDNALERNDPPLL